MSSELYFNDDDADEEEKAILGDDDEDEEEGEDHEDNSDDDEGGVVDVRKFIENEAALSGDEGSSDEDDEEDELEENEADKEELPDEDVQRDQIAKVFQKQQLDEDKRQLLIYQERLFEDGDLHMDGKMRQRKFKWRKVDNNGWLDQIYNSSDDEGEDGMNDDRDGDDSRFCDEVKINYKKPGTVSIVGTSNENSKPSGSSVMDEDVSNDSSLPPLASGQTTAAPVFGGKAGSILSYVMRDKKTVELLSNKRSPQLMLLKKNVKRRKIERRPELR